MITMNHKRARRATNIAEQQTRSEAKSTHLQKALY